MAVKKGSPKPTNPSLWSRVKAEAKKKFDVYPSAYANAWASKEYKKRGGGWRGPDNRVKCRGYNDFDHMDWLGYRPGTTPVFRTDHAGHWLCVEAHVRLNDPGAANGLQEFEVLLDSEAVVIQTEKPLGDDKQALVDKILQRLDGVLQVRESKYIMLHVPKSALAEIRDLLPGTEAPTVLRLDGSDDKVAVHAVCRENVFWETLENLKAAGASSLLVLPVEKMLA